MILARVVVVENIKSVMGDNMENDYNQLEIDNIIEELITLHFSKLKFTEISFIGELSGNVISQEQRDKLIKLYDGVRDIPGE